MAGSMAFVNVDQSQRLAATNKYRVTFEQTDLEAWLGGAALPHIYSKLTSTDRYVFAVSEPPLDNDPVMVVDVQVKVDAPSDSVAELLNDLNGLSYFAAVTRLERLEYGVVPPSAVKQVRDAAHADQATKGVSGLFGKAGDAAAKALGGFKGIAVAVAVIVGAVALILVARELRASRSPPA